MARQLVRKQNLKTFVGGLQTEVNPLAYPDNSLVSGDNIDILRNGTARRRRSLDIEAGGGFSSKEYSENEYRTYAITTHEWRSVGGDDTLNFTVIQVGSTLNFHKAGDQAVSLSHVGSINLLPIANNGNIYYEPMHTDYGRGKLFVVSRYMSPCYIQYDTERGVFQAVKITPRIRDLVGINEEIESPILIEGEITPPMPDARPYPFYDPNDVLENITDPNDVAPFIPTINPPNPFIPIIDIDIGAL